MFEILTLTTIGVALLGMLIAYDGSRDIFHPLIYIAPMLAFIYGSMPLRLYYAGELAAYLDDGQLVFVQTLNLLGVFALVAGCLSAGCRIPPGARPTENAGPAAESRLLIGGAITGGIGLLAWLVSIINVGGFVNAFSRSYGGGWDESGYVRDGAILLLAGVLLINAAIAVGRPRFLSLVLMAAFGLPWFTQALLTSRRGPTFAFAVMAGAGWFLYRHRRPPIVLTAVSALLLGYFIMFLVTNRSKIHLGSDMDFTTDVSEVAGTPNTGNEYIYGSGAVLSNRQQGHYYWGRRYLAQVLVRPIPSSVWPTKYEDFGVPELLKNAGTGEGFGDALGWEGAPGSAPGLIADLWLEFWFLNLAVLAFIGWCYGAIWRRAMIVGNVWISQYTILFALSIYLVMQTMEAVIFRTVLLSLPIWLTWKWALRSNARSDSVHVSLRPASRVSAGTEALLDS